MDLKIENLDIVLNSDGTAHMIDDINEIAQRVKIACSFKKGSFMYDKTLGYYDYDIDFTSKDAVRKLEMIFKEATADIEYSQLKVLSVEEKDSKHIAKIEVFCNELRAVTEVILNG